MNTESTMERLRTLTTELSASLSENEQPHIQKIVEVIEEIVSVRDGTIKELDIQLKKLTARVEAIDHVEKIRNLERRLQGPEDAARAREYLEEKAKDDGERS